jgi:hypothetical protein
MDLQLEDSWPIDVQAVSENRFCLRYYDGQDQRIGAHEFDASFAFIAETRGSIAEWIGGEAYYEWFRSMAHRPPIPGTDV